MLQDIRKSTQGTAAKIIIGLIVIAFAFWGVQTILLGGGSNAVAKVNGEDISPFELQQAVNVERRQLIASMGENIDPAKLEDEALKQKAAQTLIDRRLQTQSAKDMGLAVSSRQVDAVIVSMDQFRTDGKFSPDVYRAMLGDAGYSPASFKAMVTEGMLLTQVRSGLLSSDFATPAELGLAAAIVAERRDLRYLTIPIDAFADSGEIDETEVESYYEEHAESFRSPEAVTLDYIELRADDFRQPVDEETLRQAYQQELQSQQYHDENRISHILLVQEDGESDADYARRIQEVQEKLSAGDDFAALAKKYSDDAGSAGAGGDLGYSDGTVFPEPVESAVAKLAVGEHSGPVVSDAGTHFLLLTDRREAQPPSFDEMRPQLESQLAMDDARKALLLVVENLKDVSFNAEDLNAPAEQLGLKVEHSGRVARDQAEGLFANPALLSAAFSEEVLDSGHNSDVIELDQDHWVVLRVNDHYPSEIQPLDSVHDQIVTAIRADKARAAAEAAAGAAVAALRAGDSIQTVAQAHGYQWQVELAATQTNTTVPVELLRDAFKLQPPAEGQNVVDTVHSGTGDIYVYELTRVAPGSLDALSDNERSALQRVIAGEYGTLLDDEYRQALHEAADIKLTL